MVRIVTNRPHPELAAALEDLDYVVSVEQLRPEEVELVVTSANTAIPRLLEEVQARDYQIDEIREVQVSLDTLFVELVQRSSESNPDAPSRLIASGVLSCDRHRLSARTSLRSGVSRSSSLP